MRVTSFFDLVITADEIWEIRHNVRINTMNFFFFYFGFSPVQRIYFTSRTLNGIYRNENGKISHRY